MLKITLQAIPELAPYEYLSSVESVLSYVSETLGAAQIDDDTTFHLKGICAGIELEVNIAPDPEENTPPDLIFPLKNTPPDEMA